MPALIELTDKRFGDWTVLGRDLDASQRWICQCSCGVMRSIAGQSLRRGDTTTCGNLHPIPDQCEWRDVIGWEGIYQVSDYGDVRRQA